MRPLPIASWTSRHPGAGSRFSRTCMSSKMRQCLANISSTSRPQTLVTQVVTVAGSAPPSVLAGTVVPNGTPFDRLRRFVRPHTRRGFIDLRGLTRLHFIVRRLRLRRSQGGPVGYVAAGEYWIPDAQFEEVAGGAQEALALKKDLIRRGILETVQRGNGISYVSKRSLLDGTRPFFVVLRHHARKPRLLGPALPTPLPLKVAGAASNASVASRSD
jgi:hypothetical protein